MTRVLVTGATGYVGGRLVPQLLDAGYDVSVCVRSPWKLGDVPWRSRVRVFKADLSDAVATRRAMTGVDVAFYLVHAMSAGRDFENAEAQAARTFAEAAEAASVGRLVYLGGLHPHGGRLSAHLASRAAVGQTFLDCSVPALVFQAGIVIGSGSASFEMIRHLTEVLPYMPAPRWVRNHVQPIAIRDVLRYLVQAVAVEEDLNRAFDIGGPDVLRYGQMMNGYAVEAGLPQRRIAALPVLTPWLASQWVSLVSPIPRQLAVPIIASLQNDCVVSERDIDQYIAPPEDGLIAYRTAVRLALKREAEGQVETSWQSATVPGAPSDPLPSDPDWAGHTVFTDLRERDSTAPAGAVWDVIEAIGGGSLGAPGTVVQSKYTQKIRAGAPFPNITVTTLDGNSTSLGEPANGHDWKLVVVYRGQHCPLCTKYLNQLEQVKSSFYDNGVDVIAVSGDSKAQLESHLQKLDVDFPIAYGLTIEQMETLGALYF